MNQAIYCVRPHIIDISYITQKFCQHVKDRSEREYPDGITEEELSALAHERTDLMVLLDQRFPEFDLIHTDHPNSDVVVIHVAGVFSVEFRSTKANGSLTYFDLHHDYDGYHDETMWTYDDSNPFGIVPAFLKFLAQIED